MTTHPALNSGALEARMACRLPLAGLQLPRTMHLSEDSAVLNVHEAVTNTNGLGRLYNNVQNANIQTPFLDETTILDCNATTGFLYQEPIPEELDTFQWPHVEHMGKQIDLRLQTANTDALGVFMVVDPQAEQGWVTACTPSQGVMLGYVWSPE